MKRAYVGLATSPHDPALAIVNDGGEVVFAEACERHLQDKRAWNAVPDNMIRIPELLRAHVPDATEIVVAGSWTMRRVAALRSAVSEGARLRAVALADDIAAEELERLDPIEMWFRMSVRDDFAKSHLGSNLLYQIARKRHLEQARVVAIRRYDHHLTHAAIACYSSPFDEAACAVIDGYGEFGSTMFYHYRDGEILPAVEDAVGSLRDRPSLGAFYSTVCDACGFDWMKGEEWKVMGLAPYGSLDPVWYERLRGVLRVGDCRLEWGPTMREAWIKLGVAARINKRRPPIESANLAFTAQRVFEEVVVELIESLARRTSSRNLTYGGGCALNSSLNGKIRERTSFRDVHVYAAPADDGNAVGAALLAYYEDHPSRRKQSRTYMTPYLGSTMSEETLTNMTSLGRVRNQLPAGKRVEEYAAECLAAGLFVGWVQGRAEFGPRALGNRSILADPRSPQVKDAINARVKFREEYRPFAPAILHEHGPTYFENYQETPYMERTLRFRPEMAERVPGVVHVDGSGRLQTVKREWNPRYHDLIRCFYDITGVPIVLNTSFNIMGRPIIHSVEDAIAMFYTTGLDVLVIGDTVLRKSDNAA